MHLKVWGGGVKVIVHPHPSPTLSNAVGRWEFFVWKLIYRRRDILLDILLCMSEQMMEWKKLILTSNVAVRLVKLREQADALASYPEHMHDYLWCSQMLLKSPVIGTSYYADRARDTFVYVDDTCDTDAARNCIAEIREMIVEAHEHYTSEMLQEYLWGDDGAFMP
jgi:hypothetical protein